MRIKIEVEGDIKEILQDKRRAIGFATTVAMKGAALSLKTAWRAQVVAAGLGAGVANSVRNIDYPETGFSYEPSSLVYSKAPKILEAFDRGALIRANNGIWLAIPTPEAGRGKRGMRITPAMWTAMNGRKLRFVNPPSAKTAFLVADDLRFNSRGLAKANRGRRRQDGILTGSQSAVIFTLIRQAKLPKKLNLNSAKKQVEARLPGIVISNIRKAT